MRSCFIKNGAPQKDRKIRLIEGLTTFGAMKKMFKVMSVLRVKRAVRKSGSTNGDVWSGNLGYEDGSEVLDRYFGN